ncbi:MAG TPA: hypothetical protein VHG35_13870 [Gemmatimonadales bacterium]|nr:hypothetical protein [Gemmatimonadales bacterium]
MSGLPLSGAAASAPVRRALTGWIILAVALIGVGLGAVLGAQHGRVRELPPETIRQWRSYAEGVERGTLTPTGLNTRLLTETAIAQQAHARSAIDLLQLVGAGVALLGLLLALDLLRFRAKHARESGPSEA